MRIVFMGTPDFAAASLKKLIDEKYDIVGVFTQPDKPRDRGMKLSFSPVKALALEHDIPVYQPTKLRNARRAADYAILAGNTQAALSADLLTLSFHNDGVNELNYLLVLLILNICFDNKNDAAKYAHLGRGKADTVCVFKRFGQIFLL